MSSETRQYVLGAIVAAAFVFAGWSWLTGGMGEDEKKPVIATPVPTPTPGDLEAGVFPSTVPPGLELRNEGSEDWTDCEASINEGLFKGGFTNRGFSVTAGSEIVLPFSEFLGSEGERFDPVERGVQDVWVNCMSGGTQKFASFKP